MLRVITDNKFSKKVFKKDFALPDQECKLNISCNVKSRVSDGKRILKPAAHVRKELSNMPREAVCSAVSLRVRRNFGEKFTSRDREEIIQHV